MALAQDRNTPHKEGKLAATPVKTNTTIYAGSLVCLDASGFAISGKTATGLKAWGVAQERKTNAGSDGAVSVLVQRQGVFRFNNSASGDKITQAEVGKKCFIVDDETVAKTDDSSKRSEAGIVVQVDTDGVWVEVGHSLS